MVKWIIQNNLIKTDTLNEFRSAFASLNIDFEEVVVIPFSDELPAFTPSDVNIFYGSTTLVLNAFKSQSFCKGVFYDPIQFSISTYLKHWGNKMLNFGGSVVSFCDFINNDVDSKPRWFIRPNDDTKSFAGTTMTPQEIRDWYSRILAVNTSELNSNTQIFVSEEVEIIREWRNFVVSGGVVDCSRYILNGRLDISRTDVPREMIQFAETCSSEYSPHKIFVLDIAETKEGFKVIECNCFNGTGFYNHDIKTIVKAITEVAIDNN